MSRKSNRDIFDKSEENGKDVFSSDDVTEDKKPEIKKPEEVKAFEPTLLVKKNPDKLRKIRNTSRPTVYL